MKEYIKPMLVVSDISLQDFMIATSSAVADPSEPVLGNSRRSTWGDLWGDEEE